MSGGADRHRRGSASDAPWSAEEARKGVNRALIKLALLEIPAVLGLMLLVSYVSRPDNGLSEIQEIIGVILGIGIFFLYVGWLVATILRPALRARRDAMFREGLETDSTGGRDA